MIPSSLDSNFLNESKENLLSFGSSEREANERNGCMCFMLLCDNVSKYCKNIQDFAKKAVEMGRSDPRKVIFAIKMGLALALVSLLLFWEEVFNAVGQYSIWAILTVVVMFEFSIGATFVKGFNRGLGTFCAGMLAFFFAELSVLAGQWEKVVIVLSFFITGFFSSYLKLYQTMAPYEYGYRVFLMTFCILMVDGNRTRDYTEAILTRLVLIALGGFICFIINISIHPIWAGEDLHNLVVKNFRDLATALEGCVNGYLKAVVYERIPSTIFTYQASDDALYKGYRSVVESASREQTLLGFAIWEPPHGRFKMLRYSWRNYVILSGALRHSAFMIMALHGCVMSEIQAPVEKRQVFRNELQRVGAEGAKVLRVLANRIDKMEKLGNDDDTLEGVHEAAVRLQKIIDQRSYLLVNSESWKSEKQPMDMEEDDIGNFLSENYYENLQRGFKSLSETVINISSPPASTLQLPTKGSLKDIRKQIPWPSPLPLDGDSIMQADEIRTFESASSLSLATFASLLIEFVARLQNVVHTFKELSEKAEFREPVSLT